MRLLVIGLLAAAAAHAEVPATTTTSTPTPTATPTTSPTTSTTTSPTSTTTSTTTTTTTTTTTATSTKPVPLPVAWFDERQLAIVESKAGLPFLPLIVPVQGRVQTPISWPDFYRAVGRDDDAAAVEFNDDLRSFVAWPLLVGGAVAVVAGIGTGAVITSGKDGTSDENIGNAGVAVAIGGGVGLALGVASVVTAFVALDPVSREEQQRLADAHNASLRQKLGLAAAP